MGRALLRVWPAAEEGVGRGEVRTRVNGLTGLTWLLWVGLSGLEALGGNLAVYVRFVLGVLWQGVHLDSGQHRRLLQLCDLRRLRERKSRSEQGPKKQSSRIHEM